MSTYFSKYTGAEVEALLDKVDGEGAIPTKTSELENDSGFITSDALAGYATTATMNDKLAEKEDKLVFYSEEGGSVTINSGDNVSIASAGDTTIDCNCGMSVSCSSEMSVSCGGMVNINALNQSIVIECSDVNIESGELSVNDDVYLNKTSLSSATVSRDLSVGGATTLSGDVTIADALDVSGATRLSDVEVSGATRLSGDVTIGDIRLYPSVDITGEVQTHGDVYFSSGGISEGRVYYNGVEIATVNDVAICARYEEFLPSLLQTLPRNMDYGVMANVFYVMYPYQIELAGSSPQLTINGSDYDVSMEEYATGIYTLTPSGFRMTAVGELAITFPAGLFTLHNKSNSETVSSPEIYVYCPASDPLTGR